MTIKDIALQKGVSDKAIYKRIKREGICLSTLKDKATGQLTEEGERVLLALFSIQATAEPGNQGGADEPGAVETVAEKTVETGENEVEKLKNEVERLKGEVEKAVNQASRLEEQNKALIEERDFLRLSLERSQQLQAITASKIPNPPPALPAGGQQEGGIGAWFRRHFKGKGGATDGS